MRAHLQIGIKIVKTTDVPKRPIRYTDVALNYAINLQTDKERIDTQMVATELFGLVRQADAAGLLLTLHLKRLPDIGATLA